MARRLSGELSEEEFKPLRLMNGVYLQLHSYMLRIAIPYGTLNPAQLRMLAFIAELPEDTALYCGHEVHKRSLCRHHFDICYELPQKPVRTFAPRRAA